MNLFFYSQEREMGNRQQFDISENFFPIAFSMLNRKVSVYAKISGRLLFPILCVG